MTKNKSLSFMNKICWISQPETKFSVSTGQSYCMCSCTFRSDGNLKKTTFNCTPSFLDNTLQGQWVIQRHWQRDTEIFWVKSFKPYWMDFRTNNTFMITIRILVTPDLFNSKITSSQLFLPVLWFMTHYLQHLWHFHLLQSHVGSNKQILAC